MNPEILENRLIDFAVSIVELEKELRKTYAVQYLSNQLTRASISAALNYGEAQPAESKRDFIYKVKISLKESKEVSVGLKICFKPKCLNEHQTAFIFQASKELVSIFPEAVSTAKRNQTNNK